MHVYVYMCSALSKTLWSTGTTYDAKKETAQAREKKQNQLKKIEEAKKREKGTKSC